MSDGRIVARKVRAYFDSGAYTRLSSYAASNARPISPGRTRSRTSRPTSIASSPIARRRPRCAASASPRSTSRWNARWTSSPRHRHGPAGFRILNAYRDGDMKAHRREAKNCALIECVQVAAEKANWPLRDEFLPMSSRQGAARAHGAAPTVRGRRRLRPRRRAPAHPAARRATNGRPPLRRRTAGRRRREAHRRHRRRRPPVRRMARRASLQSSAPGGADHGQPSRTRRGDLSTIRSA